MALRFKFCVSALLFFSASAVLMAQTRIIPHLTRPDGGFSTTLILENNAVDERAYTLTPYNASGVPLTTVTGTIGGQTTTEFSASSWLGQAASHVVIEGDDLNLTAAYAANSADSSPAHVGADDVQAASFRLYSGDWSRVFDGVAVVNMGSEAADVWVAQRDGNGAIVNTVKAAEALAPMAKALYVIGDPSGSDFIDEAGASYEVYSAQNIAVTALRGNIPGSDFLWANEATPLRRSTVTRDAQGVWFIEGGSLYDALEAMGHAVAEDRIFQMELLRRSSQGRLAEVLGSSAVNQDIFVRSTNYSREEYQQGYDNMSSESKTVIKAYVDGVNRRIAELASDDAALFPFELLSLNITSLDPWGPYDVLSNVVNLLRNFDPNGYGQGQIANAALAQALNSAYPETFSDMFEDLLYRNDPDAPTMIPGGVGGAAAKQGSPLPAPIRADADFISLADEFSRSREENRQLLKEFGIELKMGSYAWAVSGERTNTGNPMLYSGPQMGFSAPAIVVEGSIRGGGLDISGMTVPTIPLIIIGRTPHHAWSMQVGHAHTADLYLEPPSVLNEEPHRVEVINVAGGNPVTVPVYRTSHGPLLTANPPTTWKYSHWGYEFDTVKAWLGLARAESMDEFGEALTYAPVSQHFCYVDRDGNIAYWMSGRDPIRPAGEYRGPQGLFGTPLEYDTANVRPLAHVRNPERGYIGGWNNKAEAGYSHAPYTTAPYGPFHRAHVVTEYLSIDDNIIFEDVRDLAVVIATTDSFMGGGIPWAYVENAFTDIIGRNPTAERTAALALLEEWDGHFVAGGPGQWRFGPNRADAWILQDAWIRRVLDLTFDDELGNNNNLQQFNTLLHSLDGYSLRNNYNWFSNLEDSAAPQDLDSIVVQALDETLAALGEQPWGQNSRGAIPYSHPAFGVIWQTPFSNRSTYAHVVEYGPEGPLRIESMFPLGESGGFYSDGGVSFESDPNTFSMTPFFDAFSPRQFPTFEE